MGTAGSTAVAIAAHPEVVEQAGHRRISTTQRYLHVIPRRESPVHRIDFTGRKEAEYRPKK